MTNVVRRVKGRILHKWIIELCDECRLALRNINNFEAISIVLCDACHTEWKRNLS